MSVYRDLSDAIENAIDSCGGNVCVFPYGELGKQCVSIMRDVYAIEPYLILDNHICEFNPVAPISA